MEAFAETYVRWLLTALRRSIGYKSRRNRVRAQFVVLPQMGSIVRDWEDRDLAANYFSGCVTLCIHSPRSKRQYLSLSDRSLYRSVDQTKT
jgi:hypothetical protein